MGNQQYSTGVLSYITDGTFYACVWHPEAETIHSKRAVVLASVRVLMVQTTEDFERWKQQTQARYELVCEKLFGTDLEMEFKTISGSTTN